MAQGHVQGMDTEEARQLARQMDSHAGAVGDMLANVTQLLAGVQWTGQDATRFCDDWSGSFVPQAQGAKENLHENAHALRRHADRQDAVSA